MGRLLSYIVFFFLPCSTTFYFLLVLFQMYSFKLCIKKYKYCGGSPLLFWHLFCDFFEQIVEDDLTNAAYESASSFFSNDTVRSFFYHNLENKLVQFNYS